MPCILRAKLCIISCQQLSLARFEVKGGPFVLPILEVFLELVCNLIRNDVERPAGGHRQHGHLRSSFQVVEVIERFRNVGSNHNDTVVGMEKHVFVFHDAVESVGFVLVEHKPVEFRVVGDAVVEPEAVLMAHLQLHVFQAAEGRAPRHVCVQHTPTVLGVVQVDAAVDVERGVFHRSFAFEHVSFSVDQQQAARRDFGPRHAVWYHEELVFRTRHHGGQVVADAFVVAHPIAQAVRCS